METRAEEKYKCEIECVIQICTLNAPLGSDSDYIRFDLYDIIIIQARNNGAAELLKISHSVQTLSLALSLYISVSQRWRRQLNTTRNVQTLRAVFSLSLSLSHCLIKCKEKKMNMNEVSSRNAPYFFHLVVYFFEQANLIPTLTHNLSISLSLSLWRMNAMLYFVFCILYTLILHSNSPYSGFGVLFAARE